MAHFTPQEVEEFSQHVFKSHPVVVDEIGVTEDKFLHVPTMWRVTFHYVIARRDGSTYEHYTKFDAIYIEKRRRDRSNGKYIWYLWPVVFENKEFRQLDYARNENGDPIENAPTSVIADGTPQLVAVSDEEAPW